MRGWVKKIRGSLGTGVTWASMWGLAGGVFGAILGVVNPLYWRGGNPILANAVGFAFWGMIAGVGFALILTGTERGKTIRGLSMPRVATWGAVGAVAVMSVAGLVLGEAGGVSTWLVGSVAAGLGAISSATSLWLARRTEAEDEASSDHDVIDGSKRSQLARPQPAWDTTRRREPERSGVRPS